ncbi:MAG TPA: prepilin-type N-terminal cleavage/methylation domain-containing protein [Phycisphaerae bacterium]|nr:prepilin-type N-terminal cleavage/methylation domain-containing protein [Phycisphaerae bacterium]HNU45281.1 prepilin-type N-terminal cleavage/methylation domain-containing protein [Phycisphaerae bacterium]
MRVEDATTHTRATSMPARDARRGKAWYPTDETLTDGAATTMRTRDHHHRAGGFTLLEVSLVIALLVVLAGLAMPAFFREYREQQLPESARRLEALLGLVRANAAWDGKRYRVRFPDPEENEKDALGTDRQPRIERENEPLEAPEVWTLVTAPWAVGDTLLGDVWCAEVRLGRPTIDTLREAREQRSEVRDVLIRKFRDLNPRWPPLYVEPDGYCPWVTFVLTDADRSLEPDELAKRAERDADEPARVIEVILDGDLGLSWLQRPFYEEELDLFEDKNWPVLLRQDFLERRVLTEDDVLELREYNALRRQAQQAAAADAGSR